MHYLFSFNRQCFVKNDKNHYYSNVLIFIIYFILN